jgi:tryptophan synthase beta subunit
MTALPDRHGYFGEFGGRYVPETLVEPVEELERAYFEVRDEARAVFERTELPRDFDTVEIPFAEKGEPELQRWDPDRAPSAPPTVTD